LHLVGLLSTQIMWHLRFSKRC
jgi:hypothetical protein